jgi:hypothetical protein
VRRFLLLIVVALAGAATLFLWGWSNARADPIVRRAFVNMPHWPRGTPPMRVVMVSDVHMGNATMDAARLGRIVERINTLRPDLVLLAGDFIAGHDPGSAAVHAPGLAAPLSGLRPRFGVAAVLGNHDHWTGAAAVRAALRRSGIVVLANQARRFGPLTVAGVDDHYTRHDDLPTTMAQARHLGGPRLVLSHGPDIVPKLPADAPVALVGHTHCGQIALPLIGAPVVPSNYGQRYLCGIVREPGRATIVTAGLGTSMLPFRWGAPPDLWLLELGR